MPYKSKTRKAEWQKVYMRSYRKTHKSVRPCKTQDKQAVRPHKTLSVRPKYNPGPEGEPCYPTKPQTFTQVNWDDKPWLGPLTKEQQTSRKGLNE